MATAVRPEQEGTRAGVNVWIGSMLALAVSSGCTADTVPGEADTDAIEPTDARPEAPDTTDDAHGSSGNASTTSGESTTARAPIRVPRATTGRPARNRSATRASTRP